MSTFGWGQMTDWRDKHLGDEGDLSFVLWPLNQPQHKREIR
jgi:hypothetical protein